MQPNAPGTVGQFTRLLTEGIGPALRLLTQPKTIAQLPRLLTEGMGPVRRMCIQAHNTREIKKQIAAGVQITFLHSWARSGSTFLRYLLSDIFLQNNGVETSTNLVVHPEQIIADYYCDLIAKCDKRVQSQGLFIKTHDFLDEVRHNFWGEGAEAEASFQRCRHVYSWRSPEDALVSLYHARLRAKWVRARFPVALDKVDLNGFCRATLPAWIKHTSGYVEEVEKGAPIYVISYEQLVSETADALGGMLRWLNVPFTPAMAERAASNMKFDKLKKADPGRFAALRYGRDGGGVAELDKSTVDFIRSETDSLMTRIRAHSKHSPYRLPTTPADQAMERKQSQNNPQLCVK